MESLRIPGHTDSMGRTVRDNLIEARDHTRTAVSYETHLAHLPHAAEMAAFSRSAAQYATIRCRSIIAQRYA